MVRQIKSPSKVCKGCSSKDEGIHFKMYDEEDDIAIAQAQNKQSIIFT